MSGVTVRVAGALAEVYSVWMLLVKRVWWR